MYRVSTTYRIEVAEDVDHLKLMHAVSMVDGVHEVAFVRAGEREPLTPHLDIEIDAAYDHVGVRDRIKELCSGADHCGTSDVMH